MESLCRIQLTNGVIRYGRKNALENWYEKEFLDSPTREAEHGCELERLMISYELRRRAMRRKYSIVVQ